MPYVTSLNRQINIKKNYLIQNLFDLESHRQKPAGIESGLVLLAHIVLKVCLSDFAI